MPRKARVYCESQIYHVILRGNNRQNIFYDKNDRFLFINRLKKYSNELNIDIYSYCLMNNHIHLLIGNANLTMSKFIQKIATSYAMYFNRKYERCGHLFQGRYKSEPVETEEYFKTVIRYIIQNPQKIGIQDFLNYPWNSYTQTIENIKTSFISKKRLFEIFESKENFIIFIKLSNDDLCMEYENKFVLNDFRCMQLIKKKLNLTTSFSLIRMPPEQQKIKLSLLKDLKIPINQISRITGISRTIIKNA